MGFEKPNRICLEIGFIFFWSEAGVGALEMGAGAPVSAKDSAGAGAPASVQFFCFSDFFCFFSAFFCTTTLQTCMGCLPRSACFTSLA